eukprot:TRINITY_DN5388_c0_g1_i1.p1 TRINITY_DN5388_c0_g1~~TRINITY_DN5388_c0_g1_i1.p1  ORF type:complete len:213 (-),score=30.27 TRINITY_DN5388_c0_g1_i1:38-676(-)
MCIRDSINAEYMGSFQDEKMYDEAMRAGQNLLTKCQSLRLVQYHSKWVLEKAYISHKMKLSEDDLTYQPTVSNGYPAIIANFAADSGLFAYEVIPTNLCCNGKEGFGIIERDKYLAAKVADPVTPTVHSHMIGLFHPNEARKMEVEHITNIISGAKYIVKCNLIDHILTITGPGILLSANLDPGIFYTPCFSCGCTRNRLKVRPLLSFDEAD